MPPATVFHRSAPNSWAAPRRAFGACLTLLLLLATTGCQSTDAETDALETSFMEATFDAQPGGEFRTLGELGANRIWKWERPIALRLDGPHTDAQDALVRGAFTEFTRLSGVQSHDAGPSESPSFRVIFVNQEVFLMRDGQVATCFALFRGQRDGQGTIEVTLGTAKSDVAQQCIHHEFMHAFGFLGHSHRVNSVLSYMHNAVALTRWDRVLIASLYDSRIHAGMAREQVAPLVRGIIATNLARITE